MKNLLKKKLVKVLSQRIIITIIVMLILVGVTVNVAINGGLISTAQKATSEMSMAQIQERAEMAKVGLIADLNSESSTITKLVEEYKTRLAQEFGEDNVTILGNKVTVDDKYDIIVKNTDLEIEVSESSNIGLVPITLDIQTNTEEEKVKATFDLKLALTEEEYLEELENVSVEKKRKKIENYLNVVSEGQVTTLEGYHVYIMNDGYSKNYTSLDEYLKDTDILALFGKTEGEIEIGQLYYLICSEGETDGELTEKEWVSVNFENMFGTYNDLTYDFTVQIDSVEIPVADISSSEDLIYDLYRNGTHEIIITNSFGEIVALERLEVEISNDNSVTLEQADGVWQTDRNGTITAYLGKDSSVTIPSSIGDEAIKTIGDRAMTGCETLIDITIPSSVEKIDKFAFSYCKSLKNVTIPNSVKEIDNYAFCGCSELEEIVLPNSITTISDSLFSECKALTKVTIPDSVTTIKPLAFSYCKSLKNIALPETLTTIEGSAFSASGLEEITIPNSVTSLLDGNIFANCSSLRKVELPDSITTIEDYMFSDCTNLKEITIPNSVTSISSTAFRQCKEIVITFEKGSNSVPTGFPWGADNATLIDLNEEETTEP